MRRLGEIYVYLLRSASDPRERYAGMTDTGEDFSGSVLERFRTSALLCANMVVHDVPILYRFR